MYTVNYLIAVFSCLASWVFFSTTITLWHYCMYMVK